MTQDHILGFFYWGGGQQTRFHDNHRGKLIMGTHTFAFFGE